jgi:hypothetical protein
MTNIPWDSESIHVSCSGDTQFLFFTNGSSSSLSLPRVAEAFSLFVALQNSPLRALTFPFAFETAGETFWRSALRGEQVQPAYFERERN